MKKKRVLPSLKMKAPHQTVMLFSFVGFCDSVVDQVMEWDQLFARGCQPRLLKSMTVFNDLFKVVFSSDSHVKQIDGFQGYRSLCRIRFSSSVKEIMTYGFQGCIALNEVIFSSDSRVKEISSFGGWTSPCRIEIPSPVDFIGKYGFKECASLNEVVFIFQSHVREIFGFKRCRSLCQIAIPWSVYVAKGFQECPSLRVVILESGCRMRDKDGFQKMRPFNVHNDLEMTESRCFVHLGIFGELTSRKFTATSRFPLEKQEIQNYSNRPTVPLLKSYRRLLKCQRFRQGIKIARSRHQFVFIQLPGHLPLRPRRLAGQIKLCGFATRP
jgi:hypothetical protein